MASQKKARQPLSGLQPTISTPVNKTEAQKRRFSPDSQENSNPQKLPNINIEPATPELTSEQENEKNDQSSLLQVSNDSEISKRLGEKQALCGLNSRFAVYIHKVNSLREQNAELSCKNAALIQKLEAIEEESSKQSDIQTQRVEDMLQAKVLAEEKYRQREADIDRLKEQCAESTQRLDELRKNETILKAELAALHSSADLRLKELTVARNVIAAERSRQIKTENELKTLRVAHASSEEKLKLYRHEESNNCGKLQECLQENEKLYQEVEALNARLQRKDENELYLAKEIESLRAEYEVLKDSYKRKLTTEFEQRIDQSFVEKSKYDDIEALSRNQKIEIDNLQKSLKNLQQLLKETNQEHELMMQQKNESIISMEKKYRKVTEQCWHAKEMQADINSELETFRFLVDRMENNSSHIAETSIEQGVIVSESTESVTSNTTSCSIM